MICSKSPERRRILRFISSCTIASSCESNADHSVRVSFCDEAGQSVMGSYYVQNITENVL